MHNQHKELKTATKTLLFWTLLWLISLACAAFGKNFLWTPDGLISVIAIVLNFVLGIGMLFANASYLKALDELQARTHLRAMAITLGVTLIGGVSLSALDEWGIAPGAADMSVLLVLMSLIYIASIFVEQRHYE